MRSTHLAVLRHALWFALALAAASGVREASYEFLTQAIVWLPSGVAVAGLFWLGPRFWWVVSLATLGLRLVLGYGLDVAVPAALGSTAEALLGAFLLRRLEVNPAFERLRDVLRLVLVAAVTPVGSIAFSWVARAVVWTDPQMPSYSGWDGWWRMNALGVLVVVPAVGTFRARPRPGAPALGPRGAAEVLLPTLALLWLVMAWLPPGPLGIVVIYGTVFTALWGALRFGPRGAIAPAALTALVVALGTARGHGPFLSVALADRHGALQVFELSLLAVPLVLGALVAERQADAGLLEWQARVLEEIAAGRPPWQVAEGLAAGIEARGEGTACAVLMVEAGRLRVAAAGSLPPAVGLALEGLEVGPAATAAGTAVHRNETVIVRDLARDPVFEGHREAPLAHGLRACWAAPIRSPQGPVVGAFAVYQRERRTPTAAERRLVERAAVLAGLAVDRQHREDLLRSLTRNLTEGLFRSTPRRGLVYANEAFARMFGYPGPEEVARIDPATLYQRPERRQKLLRQLEQLGALVEEAVPLRRRDGSGFTGRLSWTGVLGADGQLEFIDGAVTDITDRLALEEQLRQSQKMEALGKLAGGVAHDFNNLLLVIGGYTRLVRDALPPEAEARRDLEEVLAASQRAAALTSQLLVYSRRQVLSPKVLDLGAVVRDLGGLLRRLVGERIALQLVTGPEPAPVKLDRGQLEQAIINLAVNARDAMPDGGTLTLTVEAVEVSPAMSLRNPELRPGPHLALSVRDTGQGMSTDVRLRAFDPFFSTKERGQGTGLGLSMVYGFVRQSGGAVWLVSRPGAGTTAWDHLPRAEGAPEAAPAEAPEPVAAPGLARTVLVAEDEPVVRGLVVRTLRRSGYRVLEAADGQEALELSRGHAGSLEALVSDVMMPRLGGRALATALLEERPELSVLLISGYPDGPWDAGELGPARSDFLQKPFSAGELTARLGALLSGPRPAA